MIFGCLVLPSFILLFFPFDVYSYGNCCRQLFHSCLVDFKQWTTAKTWNPIESNIEYHKSNHFSILHSLSLSLSFSIAFLIPSIINLIFSLHIPIHSILFWFNSNQISNKNRNCLQIIQIMCLRMGVFVCVCVDLFGVSVQRIQWTN